MKNESLLIFDENPIILGFIQLPTDYTLDNEIGGILSQINGVKWLLQKILYTDYEYYNRFI